MRVKYLVRARSSLLRLGVGLAGLLGVTTIVNAQGIVVGTVEDSTTGRTLSDVQIFLVSNPKLGGLTGAGGRFVLRNVPAGEQQITARFIGYKVATKSVTVGSDTTRVNFKLSETANVLDQMVVTGTTGATAAKEVPVALTVVSSATIDRKGANNLAEALTGTVPGLHTVNFGASDYFNYFWSRGSTALSGYSTMKVYVDGVPMASGYYFQSINPQMIDRIEVIRGPQASTLYGAEAQNGVIQIFTKKGYLNNLRPTIDASVAAGGIHGPFKAGLDEGNGTNAYRDEYKISATGGGTDLSYNVGASREYAGAWQEGYKKLLPAYYATINTTLLKLTAQVSYRYGNQNVGNLLNPGIRRQTLRDQLGPPNQYLGLTSYGFLTPYYLGAQAYDDFDVGGSGASVNLSYDVTPKWRSSLIFGRDVNAFKYIALPYRSGTYACVCDSMYFGYGGSTSANTARFQSAYEFVPADNIKGSVQAGFEIGQAGSDYSYGYSMAKRGPYNTQSYVTRQPSWSRGQFVQAEFGFWERINVTLGARLEDSPGFGEDITMSDRLAPRIGLAYNTGVGGMDLKLRAAYGTAFKAPLLSQKNPGFSGPTYRYLDATLLRPEKNTGGEAGVELFFGSSASASVTYYDQDAEDLIGLIYLKGLTHVCAESDPCLYQYQNIGAIRNKGVEFEARYHLWKVDLTGNIAYASSKPTKLEPGYTGSAVVGRQLFYQSKWTGGAVATYTSKSWTVGWDMSYLGEKEGVWWDQLYRRYYGRFASARTGGSTYSFSVMDESKATYNMNATWYFRQGWSLFGRVNNILDDSFPESDDNYPVVGRSFLFGVRRTK